jgi:YVTN family beta-propeller protein
VDCILATIGVGTGPSEVANDSHDNLVYVSNGNGGSAGTVSVIDGSNYSVIATVPVGDGPGGMAYDPVNGIVYVVNGASNNVTEINASRHMVVGGFPLLGTPYGIALDPRSNELYVAESANNQVAVIAASTNTVVKNITVGQQPMMTYYDPWTSDVYVSDMNSASLSPGTVSVINTTTQVVRATLTVGDQPWGISGDAANSKVYVTNSANANMTVLDAKNYTVVGVISPIGVNPFGITYRPSNGDLYVADENGCTGCGTLGSVTEFDPATNLWVKNFTVGHYPGGMGTAGVHGDVFSMNGGSNTVTVIGDTPPSPPPPARYNVTFAETGLPTGTSWSVTFNGTKNSSTSPILTFPGMLNNSSGYVFSVATVSGYTSVPSSGIVVVKGSNVTVSIAFTKSLPSRYAVTFHESGLLSGTSWSVKFNGTTNSTTSSNLTFPNMANSTNGYAFTVGNVTGYIASPTSGTIFVRGANVTQVINFTSASSPKYPVNFTESGLPTGTSWYVTLGTVNQSTATSQDSFLAFNGTYAFAIGSPTGYTATPSTGNVNVHGAQQTVGITFVAINPGNTVYAVTFVTRGLPLGENWSVLLNGLTQSTVGALITFDETNGTWLYSVTPPAGYQVAPASGLITVAGSVQTVNLTFTHVASTYPITFAETGLPTSSHWSVNLSGTSNSSVTTTLAFNEKNGTYPYSVTAPAGFKVSPASGSLTVSGSAVHQNLTFSKSPTPHTNYSVTFTETGLPSGTNWSLTLNGSVRSSTTSTITFPEVNGSYAYSVGAISGYTASPSSGNLQVSGQSVTRSITFTGPSTGGKSNPTTGFLGLPGYDGYLILGLVAALVVVALVMVFRRKKMPGKMESGQVTITK